MQIFGLKLNKLKYNDFIDELLTFNKQNIVFTPNPEILLEAKKDNNFKNKLNKATYLTPDGIGLYLAFQIIDNNYNYLIKVLFLPKYIFNIFFKRKKLYLKYGEKICGSDLTISLLKKAQQKGIQITIIDLYNPLDLKKINYQKQFPKILKKKFPKLRFDFYIYKNSDKKQILNNIRNSNSKILFSTLGIKKQENSIIEIMNEAKNIKLGLGIGSSFDYIIGFQKRAPKIWGSLGIEWFYRLLTGPKKINRLKRLWNAIFVFTYEVLKIK